MEFLANRISMLIIATSLMLTACSEENDFINSSESVEMRFSQSMDWNRDHPSNEIIAPSDNYTILTMADSHVGGTVNIDKFFKIARSSNPEVVVMNGDLTGGHRKEYELFEQHAHQDDSLNMFFIAGNHDLWYNSWGEFYSRFGSSTYYFTVKTPSATDLFICLDSGGATLGRLQTEWLINILQSVRPTCRRCIIVTHINLFRPRHTTSTNLVEEELWSLIDLFTENNVDMVITGHDHIQDAEVFGVTTYIQVPALEDGLSYAGYLDLRVMNGRLEYDFATVKD